MPVISLAIGKSKYEIDCPIDEEEKIRKLCTQVNEKVNDLSLAIRGANEKTILMLCAIMIQEEMESLKLNIDNKTDKNLQLVSDNNNKSGIIVIEDIADRLEKLANKIQNY